MFKVWDYPINAFLEAVAAENRRKGMETDIEPFAYNAEFTPLPAAGSLNAVNATDADSSFACLYQMQSARDAGGTIIPYPDILVQVSSDSTGRAMQDRPAHINNLFGRAQRPFVLARPFVIGPKSSWTTTVSNNDAVNPVTLRITYWGVKLYTKPLQ
jgi:hypothetical protein